jgi:hypothetical protein
MKALKLAAAAALAVVVLAGCCGNPCRAKCYPYPLYNYSPKKVCGTCGPCISLCKICKADPCTCKK